MTLADKGIDIRKTGGTLTFRAFLQDSLGALTTTGTATARIGELQADGTLKSYDFNDHSFKTTALTTPTLNLSHRTMNNATYNTGFWSGILDVSTTSGFTIGGLYIAFVNNASASPTDQCTMFAYGGADGDMVTTANGTGVAYVVTDPHFWNGTQVATPATAGVPDVNVKNINNVASSTNSAMIGVNVVQVGGTNTSTANAMMGVNVIQTRGTNLVGAAGYIGLDWAAINAPTTTVVLSGTTINVATTATNLTNAPTAGDFTTAMKTSLNAATPASVVGAVGSVTGNVGGNLIGGVGGTVNATIGAVTLAATQAFNNTGTWTGSLTGNVGGNVLGNVNGNVEGSVLGNLNGGIGGTVNASISGSVVVSGGTVDTVHTVQTTNTFSTAAGLAMGAAVDGTLAAAHGAGSWQTGSGGSTVDVEVNVDDLRVG